MKETGLWFSFFAGTGITLLIVAVTLYWLRHRRSDHPFHSDQLLSYYFDHMPFVGIAIICPKTHAWIRFNDRLCEILGYSQQEMEHLTYLDITHPDDREQTFNGFKRIVNGDSKTYNLDKRYVRKDGAIVFVKVDVRCLRKADDKSNVIIATVQDISETQQVEAEMHRHMQLFAALSQCNQAITRCTSEAELFQQICRNAVNFGGMELAWIGVIDSDNQNIRVAACFGKNEEYLRALQISTKADSPFGCGPTGNAIRENNPFWCQDFLNDPSTTPWHDYGKRFGWRSSAALPICRGGIPAGAFNLYSDKLNAFDEAIRKLLIEMAGDISFGVHNLEREEKRRRSEEALQKSERYLRTIIETEPECVKIVGYKGNLIDMNPAGLAMLEADSVSQVQNQPLLDFIEPEYRDAFVALHKRVMNGEKDSLEFEITGLQGTRRWLETHAAPLPVDKDEMPMLLAVTRDITLKKKTEEALRASEEQLALVIKGSNDAPWDWDIETKQIYYSPQWWQMLGYQVNELPCDEGLWLRLLHPDDLQAVNNNLAEVLQSTQEIVSYELRLQHKEGRYVPVLVRGFISRDKTGKPLRVSGTNMDLTERNSVRE